MADDKQQLQDITDTFQDVVTEALDQYQQTDFPNLTKRLAAAKSLGELVRLAVGAKNATHGLDLDMDDRVEVTVNLHPARKEDEQHDT